MTSKLYEEYTKIREEYSDDTLVAFQIGDAFEFFNDDADTVAEILGVEIGMRAIGRSHRIPMVSVPVSTSDTVFEQLIEQGHTVAISEQVFAENGESVIVTEQKELPKYQEEEEEVETDIDIEAKIAKTRVVQPPSTVEPLGGETTCVRCGKPLSAETSVDRGMGDVCANHGKWLGDKTFEQHYTNLNLPELTDEWIPFLELITAGTAVGIAVHRLVQATGGDRALRRPIHPSFQVKYFLGRRYVHRSVLENLDEARLK